MRTNTSTTIPTTLAAATLALVLAACGGSPDRADSPPATAPPATTTAPPATSAARPSTTIDAAKATTTPPPVTAATKDWRAAVSAMCDVVAQAATALMPADLSTASLAATIAAHRQVRTTALFVPDELPPEVRAGPHGLAAEDAAQEAALVAAEQAVAAGDSGAAQLALDRYLFHIYKAANTFAVAGAQCGQADPARAAGASLNVPLDISPLNATAGFGSIWVTEHDGSRVVRVDPSTGAVVATIEAGVEPVKLQPADGRMWGRSADSFFAIDPATNTISAVLPKSDVGPAADRSWAVDGALWICDGTRLHRYDTATLEPVTVIELGMSCDVPAGTSELAVVSMYNGEAGQSGTSTAAFVDPSTNAVLATVALPVDVTIGIVLDDVVFFAGESGSQAVVVDRATWTVHGTPDLGRETGALGTVEADGTAVYVPTLDQRDVLVVDASTFAVTDTVQTLGAHSVTLHDSALWVAGYDGYIQRFDLEP